MFLGRICVLAIEFAVGLEVQGHEYDKHEQPDTDHQHGWPAQLQTLQRERGWVRTKAY